MKEEQQALKVEADQQSCEPSPAPAADAVPVADEELNTLELTKALFENQSKPTDVDVELEIKGAPQLPDYLPIPPVRTGRKTAQVEFLTNRSLTRLMMGADRVVIQQWAHGHELKLPQKVDKAVADFSLRYPFRISFVREVSGEFIPLQHRLPS